MDTNMYWNILTYVSFVVWKTFNLFYFLIFTRYIVNIFIFIYRLIPPNQHSNHHQQEIATHQPSLDSI